MVHVQMAAQLSDVAIEQSQNVWSETQCREHAQDLGADGTGKNGVDREHEPSPRNSDLEGDLKKDVLVEVVMVISCEMLCVCGPTQDCRKDNVVCV